MHIPGDSFATVQTIADTAESLRVYTVALAVIVYNTSVANDNAIRASIIDTIIVKAFFIVLSSAFNQ